MRPPKYAPVAEADELSQSETQVCDFESKSFASFNERKSSRIILILFTTTSFLLFTSIALTVKLLVLSGTAQTNKTGYDTEIGVCCLSCADFDYVFGSLMLGSFCINSHSFDGDCFHRRPQIRPEWCGISSDWAVSASICRRSRRSYWSCMGQPPSSYV